MSSLLAVPESFFSSLKYPTIEKDLLSIYFSNYLYIALYGFQFFCLLSWDPFSVSLFVFSHPQTFL